MALEERIEALEGEMKILKNEIQSTLVDIQEQILTHYYPALRAEEESAAPGIVKQSMESIRSEQRKREAIKEETPTRPKTKKVTLNEIRAKAAPKETPIPPEEEKEPSQLEEETGPGIIMELAGWLNDSVEKIGGERASKLIGGYAEEGRLAPDVKDVLTGLISFGDDENPPEKVRMTEMLDVVLQLNKILDLKRPSDITMALSLIKEENLG